MITNFYTQMFYEIFSHGFDVSSLKTVEKAIMPDQMEQFKNMILQLHSLSKVIGEELPTIKVFESFYRLLQKMVGMKKQAAAAPTTSNNDSSVGGTTYLQKTILSEAKLIKRELDLLARAGEKPKTASKDQYYPGLSPRQGDGHKLKKAYHSDKKIIDKSKSGLGFDNHHTTTSHYMTLVPMKESPESKPCELRLLECQPSDTISP